MLSTSVDLKYDFIECVVEFNKHQFKDVRSTFVIVDPLSAHKRIKAAFNSNYEPYPEYVEQLGNFPISPYSKQELEDTTSKIVSELIYISDDDEDEE